MPDKPEWFDALLFDGNGIARSLRAPKSQMDAMLRGGVHWPLSLFAMRYDGVVVEETGSGLQQGDPDGLCMPVERTLSETPWRKGGMQAVFVMQGEDGKPHYADPRGILAKAARRFADGTLQSRHKPVAAAELEFYLQPADASSSAQWANGGGAMPELYSAEPLARHGAFLDMLAESMAAANVKGGAMISEYGAGQMEVNLHHGDAEGACLDGLLLRYLVRRCADAHQMRATFLAKPRAGSSGSGMHFHLSFAADDGDNGYLFADDAKLQNAIAGVLALMREGMAFFAPFANSYRRFIPGGYAPTTASWGMENRAAAIRVPMAKRDDEKRMEFRIAGADANPHLVLAVLLSAAHYGLQKTLTPPPAQQGGINNGGANDDAKLPMTWRAALDSLAAARVLPDYLGAKYVNHYLALKESEWRHHRNHISDYDRQNYAAVI
ncbi:MAG: glutamine synthetase family protein [Gammaproteobacteria bacterium]